MKKLFTTLLVLFSLCSYILSDLAAEKNYSSLPGTQIYLFENNQSFSYLSVDESDTTKLKATLNFFSSSDVVTLSENGFWTSVGLGSNQMSGASIILCGMNTNQSLFCKSYISSGHSISKDNSTGLTVISSNKSDLGNEFSPYKTKFQWTFSRNVDTDSSAKWNNCICNSSLWIFIWVRESNAT